jgi:hypothetical protein
MVARPERIVMVPVAFEEFEAVARFPGLKAKEKSHKDGSREYLFLNVWVPVASRKVSKDGTSRYSVNLRFLDRHRNAQAIASGGGVKGLGSAQSEGSMREATYKQFEAALAMAGYPTPSHHAGRMMRYADRGTEVARKVMVSTHTGVLKETYMVNDAYLDKKRNERSVSASRAGVKGLGRARAYKKPREQFAVSGLRGLRGAKTQTCASQHGKWAWMRVDPCVKRDSIEGVPSLSDSKEVFKFLAAHGGFVGKGVEYLMVLSVDAKNRPMGLAIVGQGGRSSANVDNAVVLQSPLLLGATSFIIAHNHPSQDPTPSDADIAITKVLVKAAHAVSLTLLDHLVIGSNGERYVSFNDKGIMPRVA